MPKFTGREQPDRASWPRSLPQPVLRCCRVGSGPFNDGAESAEVAGKGVSARSERVVNLLERDAPVDARRLLEGFAPPPRFARASFEAFRPNPDFPSQAEALVALHALVDAPRPKASWRLFGRASPARRGLYLDGGFGVGKTHLLAATYHALGGRRAYLSFQELVYTIGALGMTQALDAMTGLDFDTPLDAAALVRVARARRRRS